MATPTYTPLKIEDFPALAEATKGEADRLFRALNQFGIGAAAAFSRGITIDNLAAQVRTVTLQTQAGGTPNTAFPISTTVTIPGNRRPAHVLITQALDVTSQPAVPVTCGTPAWSAAQSPDGKGWAVRLRDVSGLAPLRTYQLTLLVLGG